MANIKSAKKRILVSERKRKENKVHRSALNSAIKSAEAALENNADNKEDVVKVAVQHIDSAAGRGLIHQNKAARKKSQLVTRLNG